MVPFREVLFRKEAHGVLCRCSLQNQREDNWALDDEVSRRMVKRASINFPMVWILRAYMNFIGTWHFCERLTISSWGTMKPSWYSGRFNLEDGISFMFMWFSMASGRISSALFFPVITTDGSPEISPGNRLPTMWPRDSHGLPSVNCHARR